ncbi:MAG: hypothetical protein ACI9UR_000286 [Bacteroidia bacterium]|jgi:hypothetical protein
MLLTLTSVNLEIIWIVHVLISVFFAILFLQSGIDKITDRKVNLEWLIGHFANSPLKGMVPFLLTTITVVEVLAGLASLVAVAEMLLFQTYTFAILGTMLSALALLMLFLGQRLAKDYEGAGNLVPYFILAVINLYFLA